MFCGNIFTSTDLQNHKKNHMKKSQKRIHRVNRALFLSLSNASEEQKFIPKISPKNFWSAPCFPKIVCVRGHLLPAVQPARPVELQHWTKGPGVPGGPGGLFQE